MQNDTIKNNPEIDLSLIKGLRKTERENSLNKASLNLYAFLKNNHYKIVEKAFLKGFFINADSERTLNKTFSEVLNYLKKHNKITDCYKQKDKTRLQNTILFTYDYDSYKSLMSVNGFKSYVYKWIKDKDSNRPKKVFIGRYNINSIDDNVLNDRNTTIENKTNHYGKNLYKGNNKQFGVFSRNSKSFIKRANPYQIKAFIIN